MDGAAFMGGYHVGCLRDETMSFFFPKKSPTLYLSMFFLGCLCGWQLGYCGLLVAVGIIWVAGAIAVYVVAHGLAVMNSTAERLQRESEAED